ncbi:MAG: phosphatase PAP2 family protein [Hyphomicrobiaceae bacterium]|nr:phosphatase PAP2 family protein [Hyphomicrobiaceae bacterium]
MRYPDFEGDITWRAAQRPLLPALPWAWMPGWQRPEVVLAIGLAIAVPLIPTLDMALMPWLRTVPAELSAVLRAFSGVGEGVSVLVASGVIALASLLAVARMRCVRSRAALARCCQVAGFIFIAVAMSGIVAFLLKNCIGRARPALGLGPDFAQPMAFQSALAAFPSGHSATGAAIAVVFGLLAPAHRWWLMWLGALIALSRPMLGAHWASDAVAGWTVGMAVSLLVAHLFAARGLTFRSRPGQGLVMRSNLRALRRGAGFLTRRMMAAVLGRLSVHG